MSAYMSRPNWQKIEGGFVLHGHRLSREEIKVINARLEGQEIAPPKKRRVRIPQVVLPRGWIPARSPEFTASRLREDRLDLLHHLGEQMLESAQEA